MDLREFQALALENPFRSGTEVMLAITEELGEVATEVALLERIGSKANWQKEPSTKRLAEEIERLLNCTFALANQFGIDLNETYRPKLSRGSAQHGEPRDGQVHLVIGGFDDWVQSDLAWNSGLVKNRGDPSTRFQGFVHPGEQAVHARVRDGCAFAHGHDLGFAAIDFELGHAETWGAEAGALERERVFADPFRQPARFVFGKADAGQVLGFCWTNPGRSKARACQDDGGGQNQQVCLHGLSVKTLYSRSDESLFSEP